jgi:hypothetical protein
MSTKMDTSDVSAIVRAAPSVTVPVNDGIDTSITPTAVVSVLFKNRLDVLVSEIVTAAVSDAVTSTRGVEVSATLIAAPSDADRLTNTVAASVTLTAVVSAPGRLPTGLEDSVMVTAAVSDAVTVPEDADVSDTANPFPSVAEMATLAPLVSAIVIAAESFSVIAENMVS